MPALEVANGGNNSNNDDPGPINPVVGIIYPPPEVRNIVDKTASFVARNGPEFEARIRQNELGNPKFNFLNPGDPYHAYYQHKVNDFREGKVAAPPPMAGFVTPMPPQMGPPMGMPVKHPSETQVEDEPSNKKMRNEDSLIPEEVFLSRNPNPVAIKIAIPLMPEKSEWKLNGQMMNLNVPLSESVSSIKSKIQEETNMAPAKQKLFYDGMFFKDSNTLAYYNIITGAVIQLQVKERGGRKK